MKVTVEADGGSRGNPGPAGYGAVVRADTGEVLAERLGRLGVTTNNVAEYTGLIEGLRAAADLGADEVEVRMDSKLVVEQMSGRWQIKHPGLRPLAEQAGKLAGGFRVVKYSWIPRERNKHADRLANAAMDGKDAPDPLPSAAPPADAVPAAPVAGPDSPGRAAARAVAAAASSASSSSAPVAASTEEGSSFAGGVRSWAPPATGSPLRMVLLRHGETAYTVEKRYSGRSDIPLSDQGRDQAMRAAGRVHAVAPDLAAVVSSPLRRCLDTAAAIVAAGATGAAAEVVVEPDLVECDFGEWDGLTFGEVRAEYPTELDRWLASPLVAPPGGESMQQVAIRVRRAVRRLQQRYAGQQIAVVSHVTPIKSLLRDALAAGDAFMYRLYLDPAGLSVVDSWPDGGVAVRTVNDTAHLA
ncbi:bifunctional RNase H/acid phosphatase [Dactylosporangium aurantiacum]|uniref:bifunctional RNase H/acid phosphatase n=1 Tax=Dactylosporangium aurantiacum TaxID=35754 RepID=UPI0005257609|nr:bifunctional RNase H/acid phosphatase [Dactylosporangium aurantiacum]MDG6102338.1 bifunctional RNase H/acid phosphatase [Dactylosporangium aurantiacum]